MTPGWTQLASIVSSFLTATLGPAEQFLAWRQQQLREKTGSNSGEPVEDYTDMTLGKKLPLLGNYTIVKYSAVHCIVVE